jgi:hypothetical protein
MNEKYHTTFDEVTQLVCDTDLYEKVKKVSAAGKFEVNQTFHEIVYAINIHYSEFLKGHTEEGNRRGYLLQRIESELEYYESNSKSDNSARE